MKNGKIIFHVDMNAFFASVEEIKRPYLKDKPFAVGRANTKKGVISTSNYVARKYGVYSAMSVKEAYEKCPNLIIVEGNYKEYSIQSQKMLNLFLEYTDKVEQASIDEAFIDVSDVNMDKIDLAVEIQKRLYDELKLPSSIGIGPNLFLAKMASDIKKPMGITIVRKSDIKEKLYPLDVSCFFGIGKKTVPILNDMGIKTIGDLANNIDKLKNVFGQKHLNDIISKLNGTSSNIVDPNRYNDLSSIGHSRTYMDIIEDFEIASEKLLELSKMVSKRMIYNKKKGKTITITIKYYDFKSVNKSKTIDKEIDDYLDIYTYALNLFDDTWNERGIRLLGVSVSNFIEKDDYNLFSYGNSNEILNETINKINTKYGYEVIKTKKW